MSNVMLLSPLNDDGSNNSLTSTPTVAMETDQSVYDLQRDVQQRPAGELQFSIFGFYYEIRKKLCDTVNLTEFLQHKIR